MPVIYKRFISRTYLRQNPDIRAIWGDNLAGLGYGGQAAEMRDEPNAISIYTKKYPSMDKNSFFTDADLVLFREKLIPQYFLIKAHLKRNGVLVCPSAGVGTDRADLPNRAPQCFAMLKKALSSLAIYPPDWSDQ